MEKNKIKKILKELENIKIDNAEMLKTTQNIVDTLEKLIIDTNKLTFKLQDIEQDVKTIDQS